MIFIWILEKFIKLVSAYVCDYKLNKLFIMYKPLIQKALKSKKISTLIKNLVINKTKILLWIINVAD